MKNSEKNLMILENFILHLTHSSNTYYDDTGSIQTTPSELYQAAQNYIEEYHINGKGNPND